MDDIENEQPIVLEEAPTEGEEIEAPESESEGGEDEYTIEIDGEEAAQSEEPPLVKTLRQEIRERDKRLAAYEKTQQPNIEVGEKPSLESCDYDEDRFEAELTAYHERKRAADNQEADEAKAADTRNQEFSRKAINYRTKLEALPLPADQKQAAEKMVTDALPETLQSFIIGYADDPAKVVVALAKHPAKLQALAEEPDPIRAMLALHNLERNLKVVTRKKPPEAEAGTIVRGSAPLSQNADKEEARLEKEADRTNDYSKLFEYRRNKRKVA